MSTKQAPSVAIVGGGVSGLVCAVRLQQLGFSKITVFDSGKNGPGGRCSSRKVTINGKSHTFDHSCQYFTVSDKRFAKIVSFLHNKNALKVWSGKIGSLKVGQFQPNPDTTQAFIGINGIQTIADCLASATNVQRPVWISDVEWERLNSKWKVGRYGYYDYLVIAHNGKCADKLMSSAGVPDVHNLLRVRFNDLCNPRDSRMHLCSLWVLLLAFERSLCLEYEGAHVENDDISWISNNTAKYKQRNCKGQVVDKDEVECWTIISTKSFGKAHKVPQENIPPLTEQLVTNKLLSAFKYSVGRSELPPVCYRRVQLWGAAVPLNTLQVESHCVFDANRQVGVCGDWLSNSCLEGAAISGISVAEKIKSHSEGQLTASSSMKALFKESPGSAIGNFPFDENLIFKPKCK